MIQKKKTNSPLLIQITSLKTISSLMSLYLGQRQEWTNRGVGGGGAVSRKQVPLCPGWMTGASINSFVTSVHVVMAPGRHAGLVCGVLFGCCL